MQISTLRRIILAAPFVTVACGSDPITAAATPKDPATATRVSVDRFSATAGHLQIRTASNGLPGPNQPIDFDQGPFITRGLGPAGESVQYYNFDVQPAAPAPIFVLFRDGENTPVAGQLNIIDVIPGDTGYNDFWQVVRVTVPRNYVANTLTSVQEVIASGYQRTTTSMIVNCPVVPAGSTARLRFTNESAGLTQGWYRGMAVFYFTFSEKELNTTTQGMVPLAGIFVTFNVNPDQPNGGPGSGFRTETGSLQTHNVVASLPSAADYSPLWAVNVYNNSAFAMVRDLPSAVAAPSLGSGVALVNCPIVSRS